jgi:hypothetical protein
MSTRRSPFAAFLVLLAGTLPVTAQEFGPPGSPNPVAAAEQPATVQPAKLRNTPRSSPEKPAANIPLPVARPQIANAAPTAKPEPIKAAPVTAAIPLPPPAPRATPAQRTPPGATRSEIATAAGVPPDDRMSIQSALLWAGDFPNAPLGEDPLVTAIKNFQKRKKAKVTGVLTPEQRADLIGADRNHENAFGWRVVVDPATGIRIGIPAKLVPHTDDAARGTRWSSAHGEVQVETFRLKEAGTKLAALFEQEKSKPARKVSSSVLRENNFFVSGMEGLKYFSVRAQMREGEVRGFTMRYDQMMEGIVSPVMVAMASAFSPFPERGAPFAALARKVEYGTGLIVSAQGHIVTAARLSEGCQVTIASGLGDAERVAVDTSTGLALLRVYGRRKLQPLALPLDAPKAGDLRLVGIPDPKEHDGAEKLTEIKARLSGSAIELREPMPVAGFAGAAVLDARGRAIGMMQPRNAIVASLDPGIPPVRLVDAASIHAFLDANGVSVPAPAAASDPRKSVVRIICVRK